MQKGKSFLEWMRLLWTVQFGALAAIAAPAQAADVPAAMNRAVEKSSAEILSLASKKLQAFAPQHLTLSQLPLNATAADDFVYAGAATNSYVFSMSANHSIGASVVRQYVVDASPNI
jgi:hypothetical protein